jgi:hypothetical protein
MSTLQHAQRGQAVSEALIALPALVFFIMASVSLYGLMAGDVDASKSARLAAEHGILYQEGSGMTRQGINSKIEENLSETILARDRLDWTGRAADRAKPLIAAVKPGDGQLAIKTSDLGSSTGAYQSASAAVASRAGLDNTNLSGIAISIPVNSDSRLMGLVKPVSYYGQDVERVGAPTDPVSGKTRYYVQGKAAMLTNGYTPANEQEFRDGIRSLSADGNAMKFFQGLAPALAGPLNEVENAIGDANRITVASDQSTVLPSQLAQFKK